jgi:hypothetical protein
MTGKLFYKRRELVAFLIVFISLITFSSIAIAQDTVVIGMNLGSFKAGDTISLSQTCSNCTGINVTRVIYPNSQQQFINQQMSQPVKGNFNYSYSDTSRLGSYIVTTCGDPDGQYSCIDYNFKITSSGNSLSITIVIFLMLSGFALLFVGSQYKMPIMGFASGALLTVAGVYLIIYGLGEVSDLYTRGLGFTSLFLGLWAGFAATYEFFID